MHIQFWWMYINALVHRQVIAKSLQIIQSAAKAKLSQNLGSERTNFRTRSPQNPPTPADSQRGAR